MSEILKFIIDNFHKLERLDYALLLVFIIFLGIAIYIFFRWLYKSRLQAQEDLVNIQEKTVQALSSRLEFTQRERDDIQKQLDQIQQQLREHATDENTNKNQTEALYERTLLVVSTRLVLLIERLSIAFQFLFIYAIAFGKFPPIEKFKLAERFRESISHLQTEYLKAFNNPTYKSISELMNHLRKSDIMQIADKVYKLYINFGDEFIA